MNGVSVLISRFLFQLHFHGSRGSEEESGVDPALRVAPTVCDNSALQPEGKNDRQASDQNGGRMSD